MNFRLDDKPENESAWEREREREWTASAAKAWNALYTKIVNYIFYLHQQFSVGVRTRERIR
jgi:hypothetical protein